MVMVLVMYVNHLQVPQVHLHVLSNQVHLNFPRLAVLQVTQLYHQVALHCGQPFQTFQAKYRQVFQRIVSLRQLFHQLPRVLFPAVNQLSHLVQVLVLVQVPTHQRHHRFIQVHFHLHHRLLLRANHRIHQFCHQRCQV